MVVADPANGASIKFVCPTCWLVFDHGGARACAGCGVVAPPSGWPTLPYRFRERYLFVEKLGSGGQGVVFKAYDQQAASGTWVAVKVAPPRNEASKEMFRREGRAAAMLSEHPQYFVGFRGSDFNDPAYLVLDYVPWPTLKLMRATEGNLPPLDVALLGIEILRGVRCMERRAMVHRDLKPENIFAHRSDDGSFEVKIADLGVWVDAGASDESLLGQLDDRLIFGTPPYMSPEQIGGAVLTAASDVFAVAVVLWLLATGAFPFPTRAGAGWEAERLRQCKVQPPRPVMMPEELYLILTTALRFNPEDRVFLDPQTLAGEENPANASAPRGMEKALRRFVDDYGERRKRSLVEKAAKIEALDALLTIGEKKIATAQKLSTKAEDFRARLERLNGESTGFEMVLDALRTIENQIEAWNGAVEDFVDARRSETTAAIERAIEAERREAELRALLAAEATQAATRLEDARNAHRAEMQACAEQERRRAEELQSRNEDANRRTRRLTRPAILFVIAICLVIVGLWAGYGLSPALVHPTTAAQEPSALAMPPSAPTGKATTARGTTTAPTQPEEAEAVPSAASTQPNATVVPAAQPAGSVAGPSGITPPATPPKATSTVAGSPRPAPPKPAPTATGTGAPLPTSTVGIRAGTQTAPDPPKKATKSGAATKAPISLKDLDL